MTENLNLVEKFESFLSSYFGTTYDKKVWKKWKAVISEIELYFKDDQLGGWSSYYCEKTWNDSTLENEADLEIFEILFKIDIRNGADTSKIVWNLCYSGPYVFDIMVHAFEAVKVRNGFFDFNDFR